MKLTLSPSNYAKAAVIAREIQKEMLARMDYMALKPEIILDAGCGLGEGIDLLQKRYPNAGFYGLDSASVMLQYAKSQLNQSNWIQANAQSLPFRPQSIDLIWSNLLLPWCGNVATIFTEWRRALRPEGLLMFSSLGPDTLIELTGKVSTEELPYFVDMHVIGDALTQAGFIHPVLDVERIAVTYKQASLLFEDLSHLGLLPVLPSDILLEKNAEDFFSVTYEVIYGHAWSPQLQIDESGEFKINLNDLRQQLFKT